MMQQAYPYHHIRGGSSKGLYFLEEVLPKDPGERDKVLIAAIGAGDTQIDGLGGGSTLTSKAAIVGSSTKEGCDVDYLFLQVVVGESRVDTTPNCGNILAGVGPFAIETGLVKPADGETRVVVHMVNSGKVCELLVKTPRGQVDYQGDAQIDGVPGIAAPIICNYRDVAGSACGALLPTGKVSDVIDGIEVTAIDNGMPVVVIRASDLGIKGTESPQSLNENEALKKKLESIRLQLGAPMNLGDVDGAAVPKMCLISQPLAGGVINTRTFIPYKCHTSIGVLGAVSVATACLMPGSVAEGLANLPEGNQATQTLSVEHPSGELSCTLEVQLDEQHGIEVKSAGLLRTARLLSRGDLFVPA